MTAKVATRLTLRSVNRKKRKVSNVAVLCLVFFHLHIKVKSSNFLITKFESKQAVQPWFTLMVGDVILWFYRSLLGSNFLTDIALGCWYGFDPYFFLMNTITHIVSRLGLEFLHHCVLYIELCPCELTGCDY